MALTAKKVYAILKRQISDMEAKLNSPVRYRGTVATADLLPLNPDIGDMYNIESKSIYGEAGMNVAWNGVVWDTMGAPIDMSLYLTKEEAEAVIQRLVTEYFEKNPVKPGATTEQAQQIEQNKTDIASLKVETGSLKEDISTKITKFYASSQGETHLADSDDGKIMDMMVYGKSEQKQYSGKNLLNYDAWKGVPITRGTAVFEKNSFTLTATENDCYTEPTPEQGFPDDAKIEISEGETVTLSWESSADTDGNIYIFPNGAVTDGLVYTDNHNTKTLTYTAARGVKFITFRFGVAHAGDTISYKNIQIEKGSEATSYEPYTGGIPSPNPDYPQEIKSVVNPTVKVCGKNLFGGKAFADKIVELGGTLDEANGKVSIAASVVSDKTVFEFPDKSKSYTIILSGENTNTNSQFTNLRTDKGACNKFVDRCSITTVTGAKKIFGVYDTQIAIYDYEKCGIFEGALTYDDFEPYRETEVSLPYDLYGVKVTSGGNIAIGGQQYIADYVDVERGKLVRMVGECIVDGTEKWRSENSYMIADISNFNRVDIDNYMTYILCDKYRTSVNTTYDNVIFARKGGDGIVIKDTSHQSAVEDWKKYLNNNPCIVHHLLITPTEIDLTSEEIAAFKALATYYPTTNISINSEQLDGYTVFNYPISMENGWNYVKQQIGDTRDYIYDMDARTQDTDLQAAEAYVNSEYAVALTELEV